MAPQDDPEKATAEFIEKFVGEHWTKQETACYLSTLGTIVKKEVPNSRAVLSDGLREFLRQNPIVQVVQFPGVEQKVGAVPLSVKLPEDLKQLFARKYSMSAPKPNASYIQDVWDAFIQPIEEGKRFVCVSKDGDVQISAGTKGDTDWNCYEVLMEDLTSMSPGRSISDRVAATHDAINNWLTKNSLDAEIFSPDEKGHRNIKSAERLAIFLSAFEGLAVEDLARISIPLDILVKLNSIK